MQTCSMWRSQLKAVREMLFADDIALVVHSAEEMQSLVEKSS